MASRWKQNTPAGDGCCLGTVGAQAPDRVSQLTRKNPQQKRTALLGKRPEVDCKQNFKIELTLKIYWPGLAYTARLSSLHHSRTYR
jgi:hypothetical protein